MTSIRVRSTSKATPQARDNSEDDGESARDRNGSDQDQDQDHSARPNRRSRRRERMNRESEDDEERPRRRGGRRRGSRDEEGRQQREFSPDEDDEPESRRKPSKKERSRQDDDSDEAENEGNNNNRNRHVSKKERRRDEEEDENRTEDFDESQRSDVSDRNGRQKQDESSTAHNNDNTDSSNHHASMNGDVRKGRASSDADSISNEDLEASLKYLKSLPSLDKLAGSSLVDGLMSQYLPQKKTRGQIEKERRLYEQEKRKAAQNDKNETKSPPPPPSPKPTTPSIGEQVTPFEKIEELNKDLMNLRQKKKQPPPPTRPKTNDFARNWVDPREHQRFKVQPKVWPPPGGPDDRDSYVVESYGQTDPYSKNLIKNIQKEKRLELERQEEEKRTAIQEENIKPVSKLRSTFTHKPPKPRPGVVRPMPNIAPDRDWIKHEKKPVEYDTPPDEPEWMSLIRNRRWRSTVKARFPCSKDDVYEFERRSTTPKNWKRLAKDKTAMKMLSEIVGMGAEGEELFMRLASQRQKIEDEQAELDRRAEEELMAYEVAREAMGGEAAYSLQMDAPLPSARMQPIPSRKTSQGGSEVSIPSSAGSAYPFTTSQLEAAFLTNQLLKLHPEEFRKLMSLERSRQATLRWQFSSDPFDSVHEHQYLPYEIALLASDEPRVQQAMKKLLGQSDEYRSVFSSGMNTPRPRSRRTRSEGFGTAENDLDGYESSNSVNSTSSEVAGRSRKKKRGPPPPVKPRGRSVSPSMMNRRPYSNDVPTIDSKGNLKVPDIGAESRRSLADDYEDDREIHSHGLLTDTELQLSEELAQLQEMTRTIGKEVEEDLKRFEASLEDRKSKFIEEAAKVDQWEKEQKDPEEIDKSEISSRKERFIEMDRQSSASAGPRAEAPKVRHKVRRISSDAQLKEVFRRRRAESDAAETDVQPPAAKPDSEVVKASNATAQEMSNLINKINTTYNNEDQT